MKPFTTIAVLVQRALLARPSRRDAVKGARLGRPRKTTDRQRREIRKLLAAGTTVSEVARRFEVSRSTVIVIRDAG